MLKKEMQDQAASCMAEAERLRKDADRRVHNLDLTEKEAEEYLKVFSWARLFLLFRSLTSFHYTLYLAFLSLILHIWGSIVC